MLGSRLFTKTRDPKFHAEDRHIRSQQTILANRNESSLHPFVLKSTRRPSAQRAEGRTEAGSEAGEFTLGVTESVMVSWGPRFLAKVVERAPGIRLNLHSHRSPVIVERVRSGEYTAGICAGVESHIQGLRSLPLTAESMVVVPSGLERFLLRRAHALEVLTIESHALSWDQLKPRLRKLLWRDRLCKHSLRIYLRRLYSTNEPTNSLAAFNAMAS